MVQKVFWCQLQWVWLQCIGGKRRCSFRKWKAWKGSNKHYKVPAFLFNYFQPLNEYFLKYFLTLQSQKSHKWIEIYQQWTFSTKTTEQHCYIKWEKWKTGCSGSSNWRVEIVHWWPWERKRFLLWKIERHWGNQYFLKMLLIIFEGIFRS